MKSFFLSFNYPLSHIITATILILNTLQIVHLDSIIVKINIIRVTRRTIATTTTIIAMSQEKKSVMFVENKVVALISVQTMNNGM